MPSTTVHIPTDHPSFEGHFPGRPLLPGVVLVSEAMRVVLADADGRAALGDAPKLGAAKFLSPVFPGSDLRIDWTLTGARIRFEVHALSGDTSVLAATGQFEGA